MERVKKAGGDEGAQKRAGERAVMEVNAQGRARIAGDNVLKHGGSYEEAGKAAGKAYDTSMSRQERDAKGAEATKAEEELQAKQKAGRVEQAKANRKASDIARGVEIAQEAEDREQEQKDRSAKAKEELENAKAGKEGYEPSTADHEQAVREQGEKNWLQTGLERLSGKTGADAVEARAKEIQIKRLGEAAERIGKETADQIAQIGRERLEQEHEAGLVKREGKKLVRAYEAEISAGVKARRGLAEVEGKMKENAAAQAVVQERSVRYI